MRWETQSANQRVRGSKPLRRTGQNPQVNGGFLLSRALVWVWGCTQRCTQGRTSGPVYLYFCECGGAGMLAGGKSTGTRMLPLSSCLQPASTAPTATTATAKRSRRLTRRETRRRRAARKTHRTPSPHVSRPRRGTARPPARGSWTAWCAPTLLLGPDPAVAMGEKRQRGQVGRAAQRPRLNG